MNATAPVPNPAALAQDGFAVIGEVVDEATVAGVAAAVERHLASSPAGGSAGLRDLASLVGEVSDLAELPALRDLASEVLGRAAFAVRVLFFDKNPEANWKVAWHQDLTLAVSERREVAGFGPWSVKAGIHHVQPPVAVLERMITLRLHLDDCDAANGALRVLPGSHRAGRLAAEAIQAWRSQTRETVCAVPRRGVLLMRPLLLHASAPSEHPRHRRVIHVEFAGEDLPGGLQWLEKGRLPAGKSSAGN